MYENQQQLGLNINAFFSSLYTRYKETGKVSDTIGLSSLTPDEIDLHVDFCFYIARLEGERCAIDYCDRLHEFLLETDQEKYVGNVLIAQAKLFDQLGKAMSRDMYALEAAEAFVHFGEFRAAEQALAMVQA
ncbi:hypothetical protein [Rhizobium leguminosarum]|uniref:hypothetical protein n=1 Tax=Rhizobium leguminosarum TaxID=384 RepID=UPI0014414F9C|nr:hypothetical protein [Rhizobium leguminosarum]MBY5867037.1 hypothetical protein [Rhizobium leguminosarum]NKM02805.1 hypothetical protein [Rhizobium leguminosarum bv. viciae]